MSFLSAALCSSTAFLSYQSDFSARVCFCSSLQASLYAAVVDLMLLVCNTLVGLVSSEVEPVLVFSLWLAKIYWLCCARPAAELPIPRLVLSFPSPPIGREHSPSPAQNSPSGWWYLVLLCWAWSVSCPLPVVLLSYYESHFWPQHLVISPAVSSTHGSGAVDVHLIPTPRDDEVDQCLERGNINSL